MMQLIDGNAVQNGLHYLRNAVEIFPKSALQTNFAKTPIKGISLNSIQSEILSVLCLIVLLSLHLGHILWHFLLYILSSIH